MAITIGTCPGLWGISFAEDPQQTPWSRCLDEMVQAGFNWTELGPYGYLPVDEPTLERELTQRGLKLTGGVVMPHLEDAHAWPEIERQVILAGESLATNGAMFLILIDGMYTDQHTGAPLRQPILDDDGWKRLVDTSHAMARLARERFGLGTTFHPHAETHVETEEQIDRFLADTDPSLIGLCLDTGHHAYRGGDPVAFAKKHHQRLDYVHLKTVDAQKLNQVVNQDCASLAEATVKGVFCKPELGAVDFAAFFNLLYEVDFDGFAIIEQDMYPSPFDKPLPIACQCLEYYRQIGLGSPAR